MEKEINRIDELLRLNPRGMTISGLARKIGSNRNTVSRYLDIMLAEGKVEMWQIGSAKLYTLSARVPISSLIDASSDIIAIFDSDLIVVQGNRGFSNLIGKKKAELVGANLRYSLLAGAEMEQNIRQALQGTHCISEVKLGDEQGLLHLSVTLLPITLGNGAPGVCMVASDITEKEAMQDALLASEEKYRTLVNAMSDMIFILDQNDVIAEVHTSKYNVLSIPRDWAVGKHVSEVVPPDATNTLLALGQEVRNTAESRTTDFSLEIEGSLFWFSAVLTLHEDNNHVVVFVRDITKRRQAELKLQERERTFRSIFANAGIGMTVVDLEDHFIDVNPAYEEITGYNRNELLDGNWMDLTHPDDLGHERELFSEMIRSGNSKFRYKKRYIRKDRQIVWVDMTITVVRDASGIPMFTIGMVCDITEYHDIEKELKGCQDAMKSRLCESTQQVNIVDSNGRRIDESRSIKSCWICLE